MTRFARAKGSKASNERVPEESTPWSVMKQQLLENIDGIKNKEQENEANKQKIANYQNFLREREEEESMRVVWASFPVQRNKSLLLNTKKVDKTESSANVQCTESNGPNEVKKSKKKLKLLNDLEQSVKTHTSKVVVQNKPINVKKQKKNKFATDNSDGTVETISPKINKKAQKKKQVQKENKLQTVKVENNISSDKKIKGKKRKHKQAEDINQAINIENNELDKETSKKKKRDQSIGSDEKQKKGGSKILKKDETNLSEADLKKIEKKKQKKLKQLLKKKQFKEKLKEQKQNDEIYSTESKLQSSNESETKHNVNASLISNDTIETTTPTIEKNKDVKPVKKRLHPSKIKKREVNGEYQRKKSTLPHKMFINGKELEIAYVEGFPIKKEDAVRLKKLRKEMISKGLPRSQIDLALKLERRKAEKALAREKKKVCKNHKLV